MKTVFKYPIRIDDTQQVRLPAGAQILSIQIQQGQLMLWALVDEDEPIVPRTLLCYGTGHPIATSPGRHLASVLMKNDTLVFHFFEAA